MEETGRGEERERRLAFAVPPIRDPPEDLAVEWLDPEDPGERMLLLKAAHPELDFESETVMVAGQQMNPRLHVALHQVVAQQLIDDDPPEVWETAVRLRALGYGQHEILHMLGRAMSGELWEALQGRRGYDGEAHRAALAALPESWERERPGGPAPPPPSQASHAREAKRRRQAARAARRRNRRR